MLKVKLILLAVACRALHLNHDQTTDKYNATNYLQDLQTRQQKFVNDVNLIKKQIDDMNKVLNSSTLTIDDQLTAISEGMADERDSLYNIETYLDLPFEIEPCEQVNLTAQQRAQLQKQIDKTRTSLDDLETQANTCPDCPQIQFIQQEIKKNYNYLRAIEATVHSNCLQRPFQFVQESSTGLVDLSNSMRKDNLKAKNWIYGNITEQEYKMHIFALSTQYNLTSCPLNRPYVDQTQRFCVICRGIYSIGERKCLPCPQNQHYNFITSKCQQNPNCTGNTIINKTTGKCVLLPPAPPVECPTGQTLNPSTNKCESITCGSGFFYNNLTNKCEANPIVCESGYAYNQTTKKCQIIVCQQGSTYDPNLKICIKKTEGSIGLCPPDRPIWNSLLMRCEVCPTSSPVFNLLSNRCQPCPSGTSWDSISGQCILKCPQGQTLNLVNKTCQSICSQGQTYNPTSKSCEIQCPTGQSYNTTTKTCVPQCPSDQFYNQTSKNCQLSCPSGQFYNASSKNCETQCPSGQQYNISTKVCQIKCGQGQYYNQATRLCQLSCLQGTQYNPLTKKCQSICLDGFAYNNITKVCQNICKTNSYWDSTKSSCVCSPGLYLINGQCVAKVTCFYPTPVWIESNNTCKACEASKPIYNNGVCTTCPADRPNFVPKLGICLQPCPVAYVWNSTTYRCDMIVCSGDTPILNFQKGVCEGCPAGFTWQANSKTCKSSLTGSCPSDRPFFNDQLKACQPCPSGSLFNQTSKLCEYCPSGYQVDTNLNKCVASDSCKTNPSLCPKCPQNYYFDQNLGECVASTTTCEPGYQFNILTGYCEKCEPGFTFDSNIKKCVKVICQNGYFSVTTNKCQSCPSGALPSSDGLSCIQCSAGQNYSPITKTCIKCADNQQWNTANYQCVTCPVGTKFDSSQNSCVMVTCGAGQFYSQLKKSCQPNIVCGNNTYLDSATETCIAYPVCKWNQILDTQSKTCKIVTCPVNTIFNNSTKQCTPITYSYLTSPSSPNLIYYYNISEYEKQYNTVKQSNSNARDCPKQSPYFDQNNKVCVSCSSNLPYFNLHTNLCQDCGSSKYIADQRKCQLESANLNPTLERLIMNIL